MLPGLLEPDLHHYPRKRNDNRGLLLPGMQKLVISNCFTYNSSYCWF